MTEKTTQPKKPMTKAERDKTSAERRLARAKYNKSKLAFLEKEKDNLGKLYLLQTYDKYGWKMFANSALIYSKYVAPVLGRDVKLKLDDDRGCKKDVPAVMVRGLESLLRELKTVLKAEIAYRRGDVIIINLKKRFKQAELDEMNDELLLKWQEVRKLVEVKSSMYPLVNKELCLLETQIYHIVRKFDEPARWLVGNRMLDTIGKMAEEFMVTMKGRGEMTLQDCLEYMLDGAARLEAQTRTICDEKLTKTAVQAQRLAFQIQALEMKVEDAIKKEAKKNANAKS